PLSLRRHPSATLFPYTTLFRSSSPGQRILVLVSPGFILSTLQIEASDMIDRATRANVVINTVDARGLYTPDLMGDIANPPRDSRSEERRVGKECRARRVHRQQQ